MAKQAAAGPPVAGRERHRGVRITHVRSAPRPGSCGAGPAAGIAVSDRSANNSGVEPQNQQSVGSEKRGRRSGLLRSALWSWGGHLVFIVAGFVLPRAIDHTAGRELLGIWDFAWAIVGYFALIECGVSSSVNRYVAKHLAENDTAGLNRVVSSVLCIQMLVGLVILLVTLVTTWSLPMIWKDRVGAWVTDAQWLVFFLGLSMAVGFGFGAFAGVLTGCHRWDLYNGITAFWYAITQVAMLGSLFWTGSVRLLGCIYALGGVLITVSNLIAARRVCPGLEVRLRYADWPTMTTLIGFGGKTFMNGLARAFLYQTSNIFMATYLGPAALAIYSRPMALIQHLRGFTSKFANVLTPIASELQAAADHVSLQQLAVKVARFGVAIALPPVVFLSVLGGPVLGFWMGPDYRNDGLPLILALGHLGAIANLPLQTILTGLNYHGRPAIVAVGSAVVCAGLCWAVLAHFGGGASAVAVCVALTVTLSDGAYVTSWVCRKLDMRPLTFLRQVWVQPILCVIPFGLWLGAARAVCAPTIALLVGGIGGGILLCATYWRWILPAGLRERMRSRWVGLERGLRSTLGLGRKPGAAVAEP